MNYTIHNNIINAKYPIVSTRDICIHAQWGETEWIGSGGYFVSSKSGGLDGVEL